MGDANSIRTNAILEIVLINAHTSTAIVRDGGTTDNILGPKSHAIAYCYTGGSNALYFPNVYFNNGLHTGSGYSGTGASLSGAGVLEVDGAITTGSSVTAATLTMSGASTFNGAMTLGDETGDTITIKGSVTTSGAPNIIFSGSSGTFAGPTGANTLGGALTVSGAATFESTVQLGDGTADSITIKGHIGTAGSPNIDFSGGSGTFLTPSGTNTLNGAAVLSGSLEVTGTSTFNNQMQLGDATGDTITIKGSITTNGNPNIALAGSSGTFTFPTGQVTTGGNAICHQGASCGR